MVKGGSNKIKMEDKKVAVVLSTYNGEKYIKNQLDSILNQTYKNIEIYVRDDGSKDNTVEILKEYEKRGNIKLYPKENVGFIKSFFDCLSFCDNADYYAFCDQDDEWFEDKIERAVKKLNERNKEIPLLYFADYDFYDDNMQFISSSKSHKYGPSFRNAIVDCITLGINTVINKTTRDLMVNSGIQKSCGHDWTAYMICSSMGEVIYEKVSTLKYRRTGKNVSPGGKGFFAFQIWRIKKFFVNDYFSNVREELIEFEELFGNKLSEEDKKLLSMFTNKKYCFVNSIKKFFYPKRFRQKTIDELMLRFIFLIGKL